MFTIQHNNTHAGGKARLTGKAAGDKCAVLNSGGPARQSSVGRFLRQTARDPV